MISAVVATYGDKSVWGPLADRAEGSLQAQTRKPHEILRIHGNTLAQARNEGGHWASGEYLLFLDADDCVDQNYIEAMMKAITWSSRKRLLAQPATRGWYADGSMDDEAVLIPPARLIDRNFLVIGTVVQRALFLEVGGFREYDWSEDWDLWLRCVLAGCGIIQVPAAEYLVRVNEGRNSDMDAAGRCYSQIRAEHMEAWLAHEQIRMGVTPPVQSDP